MKYLVGILVGVLAILGVAMMITTQKPEEIGKNFEVTSEENPVLEIEFEQLGTMKFELFPEKAPESVNNIIYLADSGFYDNLTMHRVIKDFVAQGGDPEGTGAGGPGYTIKGEFLNNNVENDLTHKIGTIAFARSSENDSAGSQFYINLAENTSLDGNYAVFGQVIEGYEILTELNELGSEDQAGTPAQKIVIKKITVDKKGKEYKVPEKISTQE